MNSAKSVLLAASTITLMACSIGASRQWPEQTGKVLEVGTEKPIEGAIVVARWRGWISQWVDSQSVCYHIETADTDSTGRYRTPEWTKLPGKEHHSRISHDVYKAGYRHVRSAGDLHYAEPDTRPVDERLDYLSSIAVTCGMKEEDQEKLLLLYTAIYEEAKEIARTKEGRRKVLYHLKRIEWIKLGSDEAWRRFHQRERQLN